MVYCGLFCRSTPRLSTTRPMKMKPMLASEAESLDELVFPLWCSYKLDGIRCLITEDGPRTRSLKEIPNKHVAKKLSKLPVGLDGELIVRTNGSVDFRKTTSAIMSHDGEPNFEYWVFDRWNYKGVFGERWTQLENLDLPKWVKILAQHEISSVKEVEGWFSLAIGSGYEGLILRDPEGAYKHGRSTVKERGMIKVKPWRDAEAKVISVVVANKNTNKAKKDELGRTKRSSAKAGKVPKKQIGSLVVKSKKWPKEFEIGTGFSQKEAKEWFKNPPIGKIARFSYVDTGGYDVPRHCSFQGFRDKRDQ